MDTFERTFQKKDKTWSGERARAISEKYNELLLANLSGGDDGTLSEQSVDNMAAWLEAIGGGKERKNIWHGILARSVHTYSFMLHCGHYNETSPTRRRSAWSQSRTCKKR